MKKDDTIRVGVVGIGRGENYAKGASGLPGVELAAICDTWREKLEKVGRDYGVATYTDYDTFLESGIDAVILANYFQEHTPFAIKALESGKHVLSETAANSTLAEGVALCRKVEETGLIYMIAENYPYTKFNMEMRRAYQAGETGEVTYAEGEYNHPMDADSRVAMSRGMGHWRNWIPSTYYCTHALAPLMYITETSPVRVNALSIAFPENEKMTVRRGDPGSVILCRMNNGAVFRLFGLLLPGHSNFYRIHGKRGAMEITRGPGTFGPEQIRIWHERWDLKPGEHTEKTYNPEWPDHGDLVKNAGHGGGDFWTTYEFVNAIATGQQPFLNVHRAVTMSSVGILAWKSALEDGAPVNVPDFSNEKERQKFEADIWSPWPKDSAPGQPPPSILGMREPTSEGIANARRIWQDIEKA